MNEKPELINSIQIGITNEGIPGIIGSVIDPISLTSAFTYILNMLDHEISLNDDNDKHKLALYNVLVTGVQNHLNDKTDAQLNDAYCNFINGNFININEETFDEFIDIAVAEKLDDSKTVQSIIKYKISNIVKNLGNKHQLNDSLINFLNEFLSRRLLEGRYIYKLGTFNELRFNSANTRYIADITGDNEKVKDFLVDFYIESRKYYYEPFTKLIKDLRDVD